MVRNSSKHRPWRAKTTANDRAHMYTAFWIHKSRISATGIQNVATEDSTHEINFVLMLDGKEVPIVRSDNVIQI